MTQHRLRWLSPFSDSVSPQSLDNGSKNGDADKDAQSTTDAGEHTTERLKTALDALLDTERGGVKPVGSVLEDHELDALKYGILATVRDTGVKRILEKSGGNMTRVITGAIELYNNFLKLDEGLDVWQLTDKYPEIAGGVLMEILLARPQRHIDPRELLDLAYD